MRILVVVVLALVALGAGGVWALGQFGDNFTSVASEPREPVVLEPQVTLAANEPAAAPAAATPTPAPSKPAAKPASKPAAPKSEPAKSQPAPAPAQQTAAAETQATPAPPPPPADAPAATPATPATPAKPNPFKPNALDSSKPADVFSQLVPGSKSAAPSAPAAPAAEAPAASAPAASAEAAPAAPTQAAPATTTARSAPAPSAQAKAADPILKPQQVDAPAAASPAAAATGLQAQLKSRAITYNRPPAKLALNKVVDVTLVINATEDADAGKAALQGSKGEIVERNVDLSDVVSAQLTALNGGFKITPLTVERQKLSGKMINRWQWSVEPIETGTHTLILDIFGYESGSPDAEQLAAYQDQITVEVQQLDQVIGWAKGVQPLFAVLAALAGITSAGVAFIRFRDERKAKKTAKPG